MKFPKFLLVISWLTMAVAMTCSSNSVDSEETETEIEEEAPDQEHFMDAFEMNKVLGKGINLGNALEAPEEGEWGMVIEEEFIQLIKVELLQKSGQMVKGDQAGCFCFMFCSACTGL